MSTATIERMDIADALNELRALELQRGIALATLAEIDEKRGDAIVAAREAGASWSRLAEITSTSPQNVSVIAARVNGGVLPQPIA